MNDPTIGTSGAASNRARQAVNCVMVRLSTMDGHRKNLGMPIELKQKLSYVNLPASSCAFVLHTCNL